DEDVDAVAVAADEARQLLDARGCGEIGAHEAVRAAALGDRGDDLGAALLVTAGDDYLGSLARERLGGRAANARRAAGDERRLSAQSHLRPPLLMCAGSRPSCAGCRSAGAERGLSQPSSSAGSPELIRPGVSTPQSSAKVPPNSLTIRRRTA